MLRGPTQPQEPPVAAPVVSTPAARSELPGVEQPYVTGERPPGILFYRGQSSFWLPYHLLQGLRCEDDTLTLTFAPADVVIEGRGLHALYVELAQQVVFRIVEQGARYAEASDAATYISRIVEIPKGEDDSPSTRRDVRTSEHPDS